MIIDAKPEDHDFWFVTKNTKFEFQDIPMEKFKGKIGKPEALSFYQDNINSSQISHAKY